MFSYYCLIDLNEIFLLQIFEIYLKKGTNPNQSAKIEKYSNQSAKCDYLNLCSNQSAKCDYLNLCSNQSAMPKQAACGT